MAGRKLKAARSNGSIQKRKLIYDLPPDKPRRGKLRHRLRHVINAGTFALVVWFGYNIMPAGDKEEIAEFLNEHAGTEFDLSKPVKPTLASFTVEQEEDVAQAEAN